MSLERFTMLEKELNNALFLAKIERGFSQIEEGKGTKHELIED